MEGARLPGVRRISAACAVALGEVEGDLSYGTVRDLWRENWSVAGKERKWSVGARGVRGSDSGRWVHESRGILVWDPGMFSVLPFHLGKPQAL